MVQCFVFWGNKGQLHVPTPALVAEPTSPLNRKIPAQAAQHITRTAEYRYIC